MFRIGQGFDAHPLVPGRSLILGGVHVPHDQGPDGHSDGDPLIHAIIDALLGAAALGDIGAHFPSSDPQYKDVDSTTLLAATVALLREARWNIANVDATIAAEKPRLAPYIAAMRDAVAKAAGIATQQVSIKATTTDGLGFIGRQEGIAASAVCLIQEAE
ncbi:MAG: 2-C-methyl-D-erythritol 2,4-cyclodiphosphate synthase [Chloroflexi bacterium]|nr:MAG: 2-C-methyl-D-erythritol 2,4-cyclodiphosphate synthase [Chloroflexota bacterium]